jgi:hypothetical protein
MSRFFLQILIETNNFCSQSSRAEMESAPMPIDL